ncbi:hypothetical protein [Brevibacillus centrosporus]|uniref:hypothetical protein n=1 Tax=Brevibacillus centrosporus TaxID=54910 RepID=UPI001113EC7A|nr:hypothetical protein [Brevibacillus centrosporus]MEC2129094.1 hypothetical protein [Brevibacillus centrosporus]MED4911209.1 hypothetical protein [Brevibacillus centrosporus]GED29323.1 hypothetical protein BCE02nite_04640 [Brevibacillus centrosporus]
MKQQQCLGVIHCPFGFEKVAGYMHRNIAINKLNEDIASYESDFDGKSGDILLGGGGGSGET